MRLLFPSVPAGSPAMSAMVLNISANMPGSRQRGDPVRDQGDRRAEQVQQPDRYGHQRDGAVPRHQHGGPRHFAIGHHRDPRGPWVRGRERDLLSHLVRQRLRHASGGNGRALALTIAPLSRDGAAAARSASRTGGDQPRRCHGASRSPPYTIADPPAPGMGVLGRLLVLCGTRLRCAQPYRDRPGRSSGHGLVLDSSRTRCHVHHVRMGQTRPGLRITDRGCERGVSGGAADHPVSGSDSWSWSGCSVRRAALAS